MTDQTKMMGEERISKLLFKFSIPAVIGMVVQSLYSVVDRIFIGNAVGSLGIAGITIGFPIMLIVFAFAVLIGIGATSLISLKLGEQKEEEAELIMGNAVVLQAVIAVIISGTGLIFLDPILQLFGASDTVLPFAKEYQRIILWGTIFMSISFGMTAFIRAEGKPRLAMAIMLTGSVLNIILDPIFIYLLDWGLKGAAAATVLAQVIPTCVLFYYFLGGRSTLRLRAKNLKLNMAIVGRILAVGSPPFTIQISASLFSVIMNTSLTIYGGDVAVAGMGIINVIMTMLIMPVFGINQGAQPIIGYNYGARKFDRVKETLKLTLLAATTLLTLGFLLIMLFPEPLIAMFNPQDRELIQFGTRAGRIFLIFLPLIGLQIVGSSYFQAVGKSRQAMFLTISRQVLILIPLLLILPRYFGLNGIFYAGPAADLGSSILTGLLLGNELQQTR